MANKFLAEAELLARGEIGFREGPKNNENKFGLWFGMNFVAWCAIFCSWLSFHSGVTYLGKPWRFASTVAARDHAKRAGRWTTTPTIGTVAMMAHTATTGHVGWVIALLKGTTEEVDVVTIEGNTNDQGGREGNGVWIRRRSASSWDGYIVMDQTYTSDVEVPQEDEDVKRFYQIRDEADGTKPHPTKGQGIFVTTDEVEAKFVNNAAWVHARNLGWWPKDAKPELIPEDFHNWLISDATISMVAGLSEQIKEALAADADGGPGTLTDEAIDRITSSVLDAQHKRMEK